MLLSFFSFLFSSSSPQRRAPSLLSRTGPQHDCNGASVRRASCQVYSGAVWLYLLACPPSRRSQCCLRLGSSLCDIFATRKPRQPSRERRMPSSSSKRASRADTLGLAGSAEEQCTADDAANAARSAAETKTARRQESRRREQRERRRRQEQRRRYVLRWSIAIRTGPTDAHLAQIDISSITDLHLVNLFTVNLALALSSIQATGLEGAKPRVGLLDLDIFGPSIPKLMGLEGAGEPMLTSGELVRE
jgi:hypothetical protein